MSSFLMVLQGGMPNGKPYLLPDTDTDPETITVALSFEGYALDLIYMD